MSNSWSISKRFGFLVVVLVIAGIFYLVRPLIGPLLLSAVLAYILNPIAYLLDIKLRLPHKFAIWLTFLLFISVVVVTPVLLTPILVEQVTTLNISVADIEAKLGISLDQNISLLFVEIPLGELVSTMESNTTALLQPERLFRVIRETTTNVALLLMVLVTTYYLLLDWDKLRNWLINLAPPSHQEEIKQLYEEIALVWQAYLRGQLRLMGIIAIVTSVASLAIGLPGAVALGLTAGLLDAVPSVGPAAAMIVAAAVAWFQGSTFLPVSDSVFALITIGVYGLIQLLENIYFRPRIMKVALQLHPAIVIVGIVMSLSLAGVLVTLIIIPLISTVFVIARYIYARVAPHPELVEAL
jgi:predicted PurR-regulated permease PerM